MNNVGRYVLLGLFAVSVLIAGLLSWRPSAPDIGFTSVQGEHVELAQLRGQAVVMTFWASDCRTCLLEIPEFDRLYRDYAGRGVRVFGVAMSYDLPSRVLSLVRDARVAYTIVLDVEGRMAAGFGGVSLVPETVLLGRDGRIRQDILGPVDFGRLRQSLDAALRES